MCNSLSPKRKPGPALLLANRRSKPISAKGRVAQSKRATGPSDPERQRVRAVNGKQGLHAGQTQDQIADELRPAIETVLDDLDRWTATPAN